MLRKTELVKSVKERRYCLLKIFSGGGVKFLNLLMMLNITESLAIYVS